ncbi:Limbin [Lonchura striata]|uniref:Limbin n=1 Tax=Lonchura striata TaxID=40157 RepID=A0A218V1Y6_9PASE|nr:Limbin [Lonchura striata domestica]
MHKAGVASNSLERTAKKIEHLVAETALINCACYRNVIVPLPVVIQASKAPHQLLTSAASDSQWSHSLFALIPAWTKKVLFKRDSDTSHLPPEDMSNMSVSSEFGITLQKCGMVDVEHDPQTAYITLVINNTNTLLSTNITDLILMDNITGLYVKKNGGNKTTDGIQTYRKSFLQGGEHFEINYSALLDAEEVWHGRVLTLPVKLTFKSSSQNKTHLVSLTASLTITEEEKTKEIEPVLSQNHKLEHSQFNSGDLFSEDIIMNDQIIDILSFEEPGSMHQALEDLEVASLTRADADLEANRTQICKEVIAMMLKNMVLNHNLFPHVEKKISSVFKKQFLAMEEEIQEEYERKMVALTAECNLETRKTMEAQCQKARAVNEEAEELMKKINEKQKELQKEQLPLRDPFKTTDDISHYLRHWKNLLSDRTIEFEELTEKLDNEASEELKELLFSLAEKAVEELKRVQCGVFVQELVKLHVPKLFLLEAVEEHKKEMVIKHTQLEREEHDKNMAAEELLQLTRQKLSQELETGISEQKKIRSWEQSIFMQLMAPRVRLGCSGLWTECPWHQALSQTGIRTQAVLQRVVAPASVRTITACRSVTMARQLLSLPLSLSEEELLRMRQELHCCFSQVDSSLAWPKIRARTLLQAFEVEQRDTEVLKVEQNLAMTNEQIKYELQLEKECHLRNLENKLGEYSASLAFQKTVKKSKMLELYTAIVNVQALLFEQLNTSKTLSKLECIQILEAHNPEIEELEKKLEYEMLQKESAQQHLMTRQRWILDGLGLSNEAVDTNAERLVTVLLRQAMNKCKQFIQLYQQSLRDEQWNCVVLEDLLENIETNSFLAIYSRELRLAGYLAKLTRVPLGVLHRVLNLLLPSSSQSEVLSVLDSISKYSDGGIESDSNADESGSCKKRKSQELWQTLESKIRQELINRSLEIIPSLNKRKDSSLCTPISIALFSSLNMKPLDKEPKHKKNKEKSLSLDNYLIHTVNDNLLAMVNFIEETILHKLYLCYDFFNTCFSNVSLPRAQDFQEA